MTSLKSQLFNFALRYRHLLKFRLHKETWDMNTSIPRFRQDCEDGAKRSGKLPEGIEVIQLQVAGMPAEWIRPRAAKNDGVIFYTHGGGYVSGSCADHRAFVAKFVEGTGISALLFEYRLAPEYPYPAALDDTLAAYSWLLADGISPEQIVIVGESAGGGLCLAALLALKDKSLPLPAAAVALSPWTDLKLTGSSHQTKAKVCLSPYGMAAVCSKVYAGENDPSLPWISPLYGDLHGLPPLDIYVGDDETMRDDSIRFAEKAQAAGVQVSLKVGMGMLHCYPLFAPIFPEAAQAMQEICTFIKTHANQKVERISPAQLELA
ncbi:MAG: alpha/beta hydrolase [Anaerolineaceae bacterium]|nr:alpha/beta hydrolase [Anaerolineaceae bacterium]